MIRAIALLSIILATSPASAQIVRLTVHGDGFQGRATAVCVGQTGDGGSLYVTARHNFDGARSGVIQTAGETHRITRVNESRTDDVASFEVARQPHKWNPLADSEGIGQECWVAGFGPEYNGSGPAESFSGLLQADQIIGDGGLHPVVGDSGGPVLQRGHVVGVVSGYIRTIARSDYAERGYPTVYCGLRAIRRCLQQCYQSGGCGPNGCPIYLRPQVQQPMVGIGIPVGPPRVVGVATPVPRPPQVYQPVPQPDPVTIRGPAGPAGQQGPQGPQGEPGPAGRSVTREEIEAIVSAWLESNRDALRGPAGPQGPRGNDGQDGSPGRDGLDGTPGKDGIDGTPGRDGVDGSPGLAGKDGRPWTVDIVVRWDGEQQPIARIPVNPPRTGNRQVIDLPLKKTITTPR